MKISEVVENIDSIRDTNPEMLEKLCKTFSPVSTSTMMDFQAKWNTDKSFLEFCVEQNKVIKQCVELEVSEILGKPVRESFGLELITMDTELN